MTINNTIKNWIDNANYLQLLEKWRNAPLGDPYFQGEEGKYYRKVMEQRKAALSQQEQVSTSKQIGWN